MLSVVLTQFHRYPSTHLLTISVFFVYVEMVTSYGIQLCTNQSKELMLKNPYKYDVLATDYVLW